MKKSEVVEQLKILKVTVDKNTGKIADKLEELRKKLEKEMGQPESFGGFDSDTRWQKRVAVKTVSDILDVPINDLLLYFLNNVKTKAERSLVEYHAGMVCFYKECDHD